MKILLNGINGRMGRAVLSLAREGYRGAEVVLGVDPSADGGLDMPTYRSFSEITDAADVDCIIDFSHHTAVCALLDFATEREHFRAFALFRAVLCERVFPFL